MLTALIAAVCCQELSPPKDWARVGYVLYSPVGVAQGSCFVSVLPCSDFSGKADEWHDAIFGDINRGLKVSDRSNSVAGEFAASSAIVDDGHGLKRWSTLYSALADGRGYAILFVAATDELNKKYSPSSHAMVAHAHPGPIPVAGGLRYAIPSGWLARDDGMGNVQFIPPGLPQGGDVSLSIARVEPFDVPADSRLNMVVDNFFQNPTMHGEQDGLISGIGGFRRVNIKTKDHSIAVFAARWERSVQVVYFTANSESLRAQYEGPVEAMLRRTVVPGFKPDPNAWHPAPLPPAAKDIQIVAAYFGCGLDTRNSVDPHDSGVWNRNYQELLALFANGIAVRADILRTGKLDSTYVAEGLATLDVASIQELPGRAYGRWSEADGVVTVKMFEGAPLRLTRKGEELVGAWTWNRMASVDGLRLDGRFVRRMEGMKPQSIALKSDGTFESDQLNEIMGGQISNPEFPAVGRGSYEIRKWSLVLRFEGGFVQSINLMTDGAVPPNKLIIGSYVFERSR